MNISERQRVVAAAVRDACRFDVIAFKPGNVSIASDGHSMAAADFLGAAAVATPWLVRLDIELGEAVLGAVRASVASAKCNTNLGIILLCAPLARAALLRESDESLEASLSKLLERTTVADTQAVYAAIRVAAPAGLGTSDAYDVAEDPEVTLREAMRFAAVRDRIAFQYANQFKDIFHCTLPLLRSYRDRWHSMAWSCVGVYLTSLAEFGDSHVERKYGRDIALDVKKDARALECAFKACENPATFAAELEKFDRKLKREGVNPGTSADITVASVLTALLQHA